MKAILIICVSCFALWGAYWQGHRAGVEASPQYVAEQERYNEQVLALVQGNIEESDAVCEKIYDLVRDRIDDELTAYGE